MQIEDLKTFTRMSEALWVEPKSSRQIATETLSAVSLMDVSEEIAIERTGKALLQRAQRDGMANNLQKNAERISNPFYRLYPEQRFILIALHEGNWSYGRLSRVMGCTVEQVEEMAWKARLNLAALAPAGSRVSYPTGSKSTSAHCPPYSAITPWTQRFLDEEIQSGRELLFLRNHMVACAGCRQALMACRELYYSVEKMIPVEEESKDFLEYLSHVCRAGHMMKYPSQRPFLESLELFLLRKEIQVVVFACIVVIGVLAWVF